MIPKILILVCFFILLISFWNRNDLSENLRIVDQLSQEPVQSKVEEQAFSTSVNDIEYEIQPLYDYEIYGLVVSYEHHDGNYSLHKRWADHINVADFCIVWGDNAYSGNLNKIDFWNGQFTCNYSTRDQQAWDSFKTYQISNNHLLTDYKYIQKKLSKVSIGDQIRIKGWLSSYKNSKGSSRGTSITRDDQGNGACETIYVQELDILRSYTSHWRKLMYLSLVLLIFALTWYLKSPHQRWTK